MTSSSIDGKSGTKDSVCALHGFAHKPVEGKLWAGHVTHLLADMVVREFKPLLEADVALPV